MSRPHALVVPYPAQGHVIPMMELALCLANSGIRVTFVNTKSNHDRVLKALPPAEHLNELISFVSVSDGLESWEDRMDFAKSIEAMSRVVPGELDALIESINASNDNAVTCIITDVYVAWLTRDVDEKFSLKRAAFHAGAVASLAVTSNVEKLAIDGVIDGEGTPLRSQVIQLSPTMPEMSSEHFPWMCFPDSASRKVVFHTVIEKNNKAAKLAQWVLCNSSHDLEAGALSFMQECRPIGPLLARSRLAKQAGYFWQENTTCLPWLDSQPAGSVVYVAFGSFTVFDSGQLHELALGLELTNRPFLWVVRQDITGDVDKAFPEGFEERVMDRGKMVEWAPQQEVLAHPSVGCFVSHCGWNSTIESVSSGVPILCWPYFTDQFLNRSYIVDHWRVGLSLEKDAAGIIRKGEIKTKVEQILTDEGFKTRALKLQQKTKASVTGGSSQRNLENFMDWIKEN